MLSLLRWVYEKKCITILCKCYIHYASALGWDKDYIVSFSQKVQNMMITLIIRCIGKERVCMCMYVCDILVVSGLMEEPVDEYTFNFGR